MDYSFQPKQTSGRYVGIGIVVGLHIVIGWALASGMARKAVEVIKKPLEAVVIQEVTLPPPPPPPPPPKIVQPPKQVVAPKVQAPPPPPFVPPPEVAAPAPTSAPVIESVQAPPPAPPVIAPPAPPAPPAAVAAKSDIGVACPVQAKPEMPEKAIASGIAGTVRAEAVIRGGVVQEVRILSGPRVFHGAVRTAMQQYRCTAPDGTVASQDFDFRIEG